MKLFLALCLVAAVAQATDIDWSKVQQFDITPPEFKHQLDAAPSSGRIVNGQEASIGQFPYQAGLLIATPQGQAFCGGSILNEEWILTAAHCIDNTDDVTVIIGGHNVADPEHGQLRIKASEIIVHEEWNIDLIRDDVGLLRLSRKIEFNERVQPIRLPARNQLSNSFVRETGTVSGWGRFSSSSGISPVLRWTSNPIITRTSCNIYFLGLIASSNICLSGDGGRSSCNGDSGGPLTIVDTDGEVTQVGVVSFGLALSCSLGWPSVYARVTTYLDWISAKSGIPIQERI